MGLTRKRARGIAGKHVAPRRKLAAAAVRDLLNTRSKHDLGPLQSGSATAPPRVLKLTTLDGPGGLIVRPPTPSREHVLRDPVVLYKMHRLDRPPRVEFETRWTSHPDNRFLRSSERSLERACRMPNAAQPELLTVSGSFLRLPTSLGKRTVRQGNTRLAKDLAGSTKVNHAPLME
jgi:hypothetical protein